MGFPIESKLKNLLAKAGDSGRTPGSGNPLEKEMATHCRIFSWEIPWTEEPGGLQSMGLQRVKHNLVAEQQRLVLSSNPTHKVALESHFPSLDLLLPL